MNLDKILVAIGHNYVVPARVRLDCINLVKYYHDVFQFQRTSAEMVCISGTVPITHRGKDYNIPVAITIPHAYPNSGPVVAVTPTAGMALRRGHPHVDARAGRVFLPYLSEWRGDTHDLVDLCRAMSAAFSEASPVRAVAVPERAPIGPSEDAAEPEDEEEVEQPEASKKDAPVTAAVPAPPQWWQVWRWEWWHPREAAMLHLRAVVRANRQREAFLQSKADLEMATAREHMQRKNRAAAVNCVRWKKMYDQEVANLGNARFTLEQQILALEGTAVNIETMRAMQVGAAGLRRIQASVSADEVANTLDRVRDTIETAEEVGSAIAQPLDGVDVADDAELNKELAELERQTFLDSPPAAPAIASAPRELGKEPVKPSADPAKRIAVVE